MDRVVSQTNAEGEATSSGYDGQGNVVSRTDPVGVVTEFAHDGRDLLVSTVENVVAGAPGSADTNVTTTSFTADGFVAAVAYPDQVVSYGYDVVGNRTSMTDRLGASTWVVDWAGRATSATDAKGKTVSYGFDLVGNQTRVAYPDGRVAGRVFDGRGLGVSQSDRDGSTTFGFDPDGALVSIGRPSGVSTTISRDLVGRATQVVHAGRGVVSSSLPSGVVNPASMAPGNAYGHCNASPSGHPNQQPAGCDTGVLAFAYVYDDRGLVVHRDVATDLVTTATDYTHDALSRLTSSVTGDYTATYAWDAASNLVAETVSDDLGTNLAGDGHAITRVVDAGNQTTSIVTDFGQWPAVQTTTVALSYDGRGNRTGETTTRTTGGTTHVLNAVTYTFDGMDQLTRSHDTGGNQNNAKDDLITTWSRDGIGRALSVTEAGITKARVFDGADVVVDGPTRVTRGPDGRVLFEAFETVEGHGRNAHTVTVTRDVLTDVLGSGVSIATGGLVTADLALFADFGDLVTTPDWATSTGFTGRTTAGDLVEFATRAYDPATRVWVQADTYPGTTTRSASLNGYAYVEGAPETFTDALGFDRADAAIRALRLSAAETAYLMAVAAQFRATPGAPGTTGATTAPPTGRTAMSGSTPTRRSTLSGSTPGPNPTARATTGATPRRCMPARSSAAQTPAPRCMWRGWPPRR